MRPTTRSIRILVYLLAFLPVSTAVGQEVSYQIVDIIDLPPELHITPDSSCLMEFHEQWILNSANLSISKKVMEYEVSCVIKESFRLREVSYEFSFPDAHHEMTAKEENKESGLIDSQVRDLLNHLISLIQAGKPIAEVYRPQEQLLSVYFHEEWILETKNQEFIKKVKGITPVIWQVRQTTDGEPIQDAESGLPVYYKTKLERIDLRNP
jgi:hypothetical protein